MELACVRVVPQRHGMDCVICCLAMLLGTSYEAALLAVSKVRPDAGTTGLFWTDAKKAAAQFGAKLRTVRKYSPDDVVGIVDLIPKTKQQPNHHAALLIRGAVIDPYDGGSVWPEWEAYEYGNNFTFGAVLTQVKRAH